jgi:hypothetical protein
MDLTKEEVRVSARNPVYVDYGHTGTYYLWVWRGSLLVEGPFTLDEDQDWGDLDARLHYDFWSDYETSYRGRYDPSAEVVTILVPDRWKHRETPTSLTNALLKKFPRASLKRFN